MRKIDNLETPTSRPDAPLFPESIGLEPPNPDQSLVDLLPPLLRDVASFSAHASGLTLRAYQTQVASAICGAVLRSQGLTFVVMFPRQSGKNELQAQIETYLLTLYSGTDAEIVKVSPTWKPQSLNAMRRLERVLKRNLIARDLWKKESGYIYKLGAARIFFLSGGPESNIVGATASTLLEVDEAQDVLIPKFDKDIAPMAASTNATRVFWGTAWISRTLLARELRVAREAEKKDQIRRVFVLNAGQVAAEVPAYRAFVADQVARLGRSHPMVKTQFYSEEIDSQGGMFPAERLALMRGTHPRQAQPTPGRIYALLLDIAGEDEHGPDHKTAESNPGRRDATALTIVEVDLSTVSDTLICLPTYRAVERRLWVGVRHTALYGEVRALAQTWGMRGLVVDATGIGAGLASFLERAFPGKVLRFLFNSATKSKLGWAFLSLVETGRWKEHADHSPEQMIFWRQLQACQMEVLPGPDRRIKWGVPDGTQVDGEIMHDDLVLSAALAAALDEQTWSIAGSPLVIQARDPLADISGY